MRKRFSLTLDKKWSICYNSKILTDSILTYFHLHKGVEMMKRIISVLAAGVMGAALCISMTACGCSSSKGVTMPTAGTTKPTVAATTKPSATGASSGVNNIANRLNGSDNANGAQDNNAYDNNQAQQNEQPEQSSQVQAQQSSQGSQMQQSSQAQQSSQSSADSKVVSNEQQAGQELLNSLEGEYSITDQTVVNDDGDTYYRIAVRDVDDEDYNIHYYNVFEDGQVVPEGD